MHSDHGPDPDLLKKRSPSPFPFTQPHPPPLFSVPTTIEIWERRGGGFRTAIGEDAPIRRCFRFPASLLFLKKFRRRRERNEQGLCRFFLQQVGPGDPELPPQGVEFGARQVRREHCGLAAPRQRQAAAVEMGGRGAVDTQSRLRRKCRQAFRPAASPPTAQIEERPARPPLGVRRRALVVGFAVGPLLRHRPDGEPRGQLSFHGRDSNAAARR